MECGAAGAIPSHLLQGAAAVDHMQAFGGGNGGGGVTEADAAMAAHLEEVMQHHHHQHPDMMNAAPATAGGEWAHDFQHHHHHHHHHMMHQHHHQQQQQMPWAMEAEQAWAAEAEHQQQQQQQAAAAPSAVADSEWAQDFNSENVQVYGIEGEGPPLAFEEKQQLSEFNGLMDDLKTGRAEIVEGDGDGENVLAQEAHAGENDEVAETYNELTDTAENNAETNFEDMFEGVARTGALPVDANGEFTEEFLAEQRARQHLQGDNEGEEDVHEFLAQQAALEEGGADDEWMDQFNGNEADNWVQEYMDTANKADSARHASEYPFDENNPYLFHENPFEEGINFVGAGVLSEAVLAFEAACQQHPEKLECWQYLGTTQAENEKDSHAIIALQKARNLCPTQPQVLLALSASYTNEMMPDHARLTLKQWLKCDPKFADLEEHLQAIAPGPEEEAAAAAAAVNLASGPAMMDDDDENAFVNDYFFTDSGEHKKVCQLFEAASQIDPANVEIHVALGTLCHLGNDYLKAAAHFEDAVKLNPENEKLWNKLGATLANGQQSERAIAAYERALDINPGFVRAQYNLGIANSNLGRHREASRHFVKAIMLQSGWTDPSSDEKAPTRSTRDIWDVLRMSLGCIERPDLVQASWQHKLTPFVSEFGCAPAALAE